VLSSLLNGMKQMGTPMQVQIPWDPSEHALGRTSASRHICVYAHVCVYMWIYIYIYICLFICIIIYACVYRGASSGVSHARWLIQLVLISRSRFAFTPLVHQHLYTTGHWGI
jgi:hypothetical protein